MRPAVWTNTEVLRSMTDQHIVCVPDADWPTIASDTAVLLGSESFLSNGKEHLAIAVSSKALLNVPGQLANQDYVKLCGDTTFNIVLGDWCITTIGVLTKHYSRSRGPGDRSLAQYSS